MLAFALPHPVVDQELPDIAALQHSLAEAPENIESCSHLRPAHFP